MDIQEILNFSFIFPLAAGIIFVFLVLYMFREDVQKDNYLGCVSGYMNTRSSRMKPLLFSDFDNIPNAANLVEKYSFDSDPSIRVKIVDVIDAHFDKIPNAGEIIKRLSYDQNQYVKYSVADVIDRHFDKIPNAGEIIKTFSYFPKDAKSAVAKVIKNHFDKIHDAGRITEELSHSSDIDVKLQCAKILKNHFDKIHDAGKIFADSYKYGETDENMNLLSIEILRDHFNKIPKAPEIFINILGTVMTTSTSEDDEIIFQSVIRIFSEHFYEIPDAEELLEIFMTIVNKKEYLKELCKQQYFKNFFVNIPNGMEILKKNRII